MPDDHDHGSEMNPEVNNPWFIVYEDGCLRCTMCQSVDPCKCVR